MSCESLSNNLVHSLLRREIDGSSVPFRSAVDHIIQNNISQGIFSSYEVDLGCHVVNGRTDFQQNSRFLAFGESGRIALFDLYRRKLMWEATFQRDGLSGFNQIHLSLKGIVAVVSPDYGYCCRIFFEGKQTGMFYLYSVIKDTLRVVDDKFVAVTVREGIASLTVWDKTGSPLKVINYEDVRLIVQNRTIIEGPLATNSSDGFYVAAVRINERAIGVAFDFITDTRRILDFSSGDRDVKVLFLAISGNSVIYGKEYRGTGSKQYRIMQMNLSSGKIEFEYPVPESCDLLRGQFFVNDRYIAYGCNIDRHKQTISVINRKTHLQEIVFEGPRDYRRMAVSITGDVINIASPKENFTYRLVVMNLLDGSILRETEYPRRSFEDIQFEHGRLIHFKKTDSSTHILVEDYVCTADRHATITFGIEAKPLLDTSRRATINAYDDDRN